MDQGLALVIITGAVAAVYLVLAIRNFVLGRTSYGFARLFAAVLFAAAAVFIAVQMRLF
jgi:hypothetical protein